MKKKAVVLGLFLSLIAFFSFKLLEIPRGLTLDEAAFGYNAALLAKTGRDENHRFMPLFVLSSSGTDWRQPVTQYYLAALFKLFGPSLFLLRFSSVLIVVGSVIGLYLLVRETVGKIGGLAAAVAMITTPLVMIQSHMALDNIMPIPFTLAWMWAVSRFLKDKSDKWIVMMGVSLGLSMYSYKGMRAIVPVWLLLSALTIFKVAKKQWLKKVSYLALSSGPFFLIIPWIESRYPGAMMGGAKAVFNNFYEFLAPYLSSFDISYWFVTGDLVSIHSTGLHGMYLLASAPWFFLGVFLAIKERERFFHFLLAVFFSGPLLFGLVGSVHRFSRLMMMIPIYSLFVGLAVSWAWSRSRTWKMILLGGALFATINFGDFLRYYWVTFPGITEIYTGVITYKEDLREIASISRENKTEPVLSEHVARSIGEGGKFFQIIYFGKILRTIGDNVPPKSGEVLLSAKDNLEDSDLISKPAQFKIFAPKVQ